MLQSQLSCRCAEAVTEFLEKEGFPAYDEATGRGTVRHIFCRQARHTGDAVLVITTAKGFGARTGALAGHLRARCPELTGIVLNINKSAGNTVLSGDFYPLWGCATLHDSLCGYSFEIAPQAFFQINPPQAERLYEKAAAYAAAKPEDLVFDLYCGAGTISLRMARDAGKVIGAEIVPEAVENARQNAARNGVSNVEFLCGDAGEAAAALAARGLRPRIVVVDPPRKGMSQEAINAIASMSPERIVYVSCNPATLARDILRFQEQSYTLREVTAVDMFPRTCHVETVCCLYHQKKDFISVPYEPKNVE
jgi:23S rRNA (uracil1939-C5)-methyltransferase